MTAAWLRSKLTLTRTIIAVNVGIALTAWLLAHFGVAGVKSDFIHTYFPLHYRDLSQGKFWELFSYSWVHAPLDGVWSLHLLFNMIALASLGRAVEERLGPKNFAIVYFGGGIFAGICALLEMSVRDMLGLPIAPPLAGASGAVLAVAAAFAWMCPEEKLFVFPVPVPIQARKVIFGLLGISWLLLLAWPGSIISHSAHIGGLVWGLFWMWFIEHSSFRWRRRGRTLTMAYPASFSEMDDPMEEWEDSRLRVEADRVLEKIHHFGIESLTPTEKTILDRARHLL